MKNEKFRKTSANPMDLRLGVENLSGEIMTVFSIHPQRLQHCTEHRLFTVPPGYFVELPHRWYDFTVPSGTKEVQVRRIEGIPLDRAKDKHSARFVFKID